MIDLFGYPYLSNESMIYGSNRFIFDYLSGCSKVTIGAQHGAFGNNKWIIRKRYF